MKIGRFRRWFTSFWDRKLKFQQMLDLGFSDTSQNFSSLRQLFFHTFQKYTLVFKVFYLWAPLETMKKSCLKELKFCEVLGTLESSIYWKFQLSISKTGESSYFLFGIPFWFFEKNRSIDSFKKQIFSSHIMPNRLQTLKFYFSYKTVVNRIFYHFWWVKLKKLWKIEIHSSSTRWSCCLTLTPI